MKQFVFIILLALFATNLSAQKAVRKSIRKGNKAFKEQRYSAAESDYSTALKGDASSKEASFNLANTYYKQKKYDDAINEYKHYLTIENNSPEKMSAAWNNMGNTYLKKETLARTVGEQQGVQDQEANYLKMSMESYKKALRLNPQDDETRENLAIVQKMIKDQEDKKEDKQDNKQDNKQDKEDKNKKEDKKEDSKNDKNDGQKEKPQDQNQMSEDNIEQILKAIEQDERETQKRVNQMKAEERKNKNEDNRRQNKDW